MILRLPAIAAALAIGLAAPATTAVAYETRVPVERVAPGVPYDLRDADVLPGAYGYCVPSSASEGNANQQNFPVKQYGQTSGGSAC